MAFTTTAPQKTPSEVIPSVDLRSVKAGKFLRRFRLRVFLEFVALDANPSTSEAAESGSLRDGVPAMAPQPMDPWLFFSAIALVAIGLVSIYSASGWHEYLATQNQSQPSFDGLLRKQGMMTAIGVTLAAILACMDYRIMRRVAGWCLFASLVGLVLAYCIGPEINGARRWLRIASMSIQPSEFAKVSLVIYLAAMLARQGELVQSFVKGFLPLMGVAGVTMGLIVLGKDLGTTALLGAVTLAMLFVAGARVVYMLATVLAALPLLWALIAAQPYRLQRIADYLRDGGHQVQQGLIAIGSGGVWGLGLGQGRQKLGPLPENHNDFILASLAEEMGLVGVFTVIALFVLFVLRGLRAVDDAPDRFGAYLAAGFSAMIGGQALINMAVVFKIVPAKGIALPFISSGGSSMISCMIAVGLMLSVSRRPLPGRFAAWSAAQSQWLSHLLSALKGKLTSLISPPRRDPRLGRPNLRH